MSTDDSAGIHLFGKMELSFFILISCESWTQTLSFHPLMHSYILEKENKSISRGKIYIEKGLKKKQFLTL